MSAVSVAQISKLHCNAPAHRPSSFSQSRPPCAKAPPTFSAFGLLALALFLQLVVNPPK
jgi:hypothetical protein